MKPTEKFVNTDYDEDFQTWVGRWLYSFCSYIETKQEEEDSMTKLLLFISEARLEGKVNSRLINALDTFIQESFKPDLPRLCLRQFIDTPGGCYGDNSFTESDNSALKRDVCGPKPNNKLHIALDATISHTNKRFKKLDMDAHKLTGKTSLCSGVVSAEYHELSKMLNPHTASELERQWKASETLDCIEGKSNYLTQFAQKRCPHLIVHFVLLRNLRINV